MSIKRIFPIFALLIVASISITACSPKTAPDQPASTPTEKPSAQPTVNPFNPSNLGNCYNPFNPVMEGKVWKYAMVSGDATSALEISYKDVTPSSFTSVQKFPDISTEVQWTCSPDGILSNQFVNMSIPQVPELTYETLEVKGVFFPKENLWQVGYSWTTEYLIKVKYTSGDTIFEGEGVVNVANVILAVEPVTAVSGTYNDAFRVDATGNIKMSIMGAENTLPITFINWYVRDVGLVKSVSTDPTLSYSMELTSLE